MARRSRKGRADTDPGRGEESGARIPGRGATCSPAARFLDARTELVDDGWDRPAPDDDVSPCTRVRAERSGVVISYNRSPDLPFDRAINPYRGCEHGCVYCFARPGHAWLDLSPGLEFETHLVRKAGAAAALARELSRPGYVCRPIALGASTDPYQPIERQYRVTRELLETLARYEHPVSITTKGALIERDVDLLAAMARRGLASVAVSITTLEPELKRRLEPRAPSGARRLEIVRRLAEAGVPVSVLAAPVIPFVNDHELERILEHAAAAGATAAAYVVLRLPHELVEIFEDWLSTHFPDRRDRVLAAVRSMRGGKLYDGTFGRRQTGEGEIARLIARRFAVARRRHGLSGDERFALDTGRFAPPVGARSLRAPARPGDGRTPPGQLGLFVDQSS